MVSDEKMVAIVGTTEKLGLLLVEMNCARNRVWKGNDASEDDEAEERRTTQMKQEFPVSDDDTRLPTSRSDKKRGAPKQ